MPATRCFIQRRKRLRRSFAKLRTAKSAVMWTADMASAAPHHDAKSFRERAQAQYRRDVVSELIA
jgi:hypothetical protein